MEQTIALLRTNQLAVFVLVDWRWDSGREEMMGLWERRDDGRWALRWDWEWGERDGSEDDEQILIKGTMMMIVNDRGSW